MRKAFTWVFAVLSLMAAGAISVSAAEKKISREDLPAAVRKTADEQTQGATVRGYSKETEAGQLEYEVQVVIDGHNKDITIAPDGRLLEIEEEVSLNSLPPAVQSGLTARAASGKITKVESLTKHGSIVAYEAQVLKGSRRSEVQVGPDGKPLDHEE